MKEKVIKSMDLVQLLLVLIIIGSLYQAPRCTIGDWVATVFICLVLIIDLLVYGLEKLILRR